MTGKGKHCLCSRAFLFPLQKGNELEEGVTSEEFDKFLEERAKAAEMVPNLPSPPLEAPTPPTNPSSRKKQERSEDALFAL
ncbi:hypothetical protein DV515_00013475 [Chloebia gouldiae]|uniref:Uncharacterized protein n=1 Tax=Chloebia gouldiae TaxID=44316 RepID=A0A3L8S1C2_CHLGU|nr:hypothetical protein DV515_00013475 [Chloebia gouldiae]